MNVCSLFLILSADPFLARKSLDPNCIVCVNSNDNDMPLNCGVVGPLHMQPSWHYHTTKKKVIMTSIVTSTNSIFFGNTTKRLFAKKVEIDFGTWNPFKKLGFNTARECDYWTGYPGFGDMKIRDWDGKVIHSVRDCLIAARDILGSKAIITDLIKHRTAMLVFRHQLVPIQDQPGRCEPLHPFEPETLNSLPSDSDTVNLFGMGDLEFLHKYAPNVHAELTMTTFLEGLPGQAVLYDHDHCSFPLTCGAYGILFLTPVIIFVIHDMVFYYTWYINS